MEKENNHELDRNFILRSGSILGIVAVAYTYLAYTMGLDFMVSFTNVFLSFAVSIGIVIYFALQYRKTLGGYVGFKSLFKVLYLVVSMGILLDVLFDYTLHTIIDPQLDEKVITKTTEKTIRFMEKLGVDDKQLDQTEEKLNEIKNNVEDNKRSFMSLLSSYFTTMFLWVFPILLISVIIKKEKPFFES